MNNKLANLIKLQGFDLELDSLAKKVEFKQNEIQKHAEELKALGTVLEAAKGELTKLQLRKKELELEIDGKEQQVKKLQAELNNVKTNDAYKALLKEIEQAKAAQNALEESLLNVLQKLEDDQKNLKEKEKSSKQQEQEIKTETQNSESQLTQIQNLIKDKNELRNSFSQQIEESLRTRYDSIRRNKGGQAVVPILGNACGGCRQNLTLHVINDVNKNQSLVSCETCSRILFLEETPAASPASNNLSPT